MTVLFISISIIVFILGIVITLNGKKKKRNGINTINEAAVTVFISGVFMFIPVYEEYFRGDTIAHIKTVLISMHSTIRLFIVDGEFDIIKDYSSLLFDGLAYSIFTGFAALLFVMAPLLTFGFLIYLVKNVFAKITFLMSYFQELYVFSELNEESLCLAKSIKDGNKKARIIFTDVFESNDEKIYELMQRAKEIAAICFKSDIELINYNEHSRNSRIYLFVIDHDEAENLRQAVALIDEYKCKNNILLYLFSSSIESEIILSNMDKGSMIVRRINIDGVIVQNFLYDKGSELFKTATASGEINVLVAGMDGLGNILVKSIAWAGQMDGYELSITAVDPGTGVKSRFMEECSELIDEAHNGVHIDGDSYYSIQIYDEINIWENRFKVILAKKEYTYVFVDFGNDAENIRTAAVLRMEFERLNLHPVIVAKVANIRFSRQLKELHNFRNEQYDIQFIGSMDHVYSQNVIIASELEKKALEIHLTWGEENEFWNYEYNYRSSISSAIHSKLKIELGIASTPELEHKRWNAYMRSIGYIYSGSTEESSRNDLGKMHHDLIPYEKLSDEDKKKDIKIVELKQER